jgi:hypothetical protein
VTSVTESATTLSADYPAQTLTVSAHAVNVPGTASPPTSLFLDMDSTAPTAGSYWEGPLTNPISGFAMSWNMLLTLTSGTMASGTWSGSATPPVGYGGTFTLGNIWVEDGSSAPELDQAQLAAAGAAPYTTVAKVAAATPTGLKWTSKLGLHPLLTLSWTSANELFTTVDSWTGSGCGKEAPTVDLGEILFGEPGFGLCSVKLHTWNTAGRSAEVSSTTFVL